jgi:hypothetical protein
LYTIAAQQLAVRLFFEGMAMRLEEQTDVSERYLWLEGKVSKKALALLEKGLPASKPTNSDNFFVGFSYADLPLIKEFDVAFPKGKPELGFLCQSRILAVTQQFAHPWDTVPHGWKTVCLIEFPDGMPSLVLDLPEVDNWYIVQEYVCLCSHETWEHLIRVGRK